jgi:hypothetical protein
MISKEEIKENFSKFEIETIIRNHNYLNNTHLKELCDDLRKEYGLDPTDILLNLIQATNHLDELFSNELRLKKLNDN